MFAKDHLLRQSFTYKEYAIAQETQGKCMLEEPPVPPAKFILNVDSINKLAVQLECHTQLGKADDSLVS